MNEVGYKGYVIRPAPMQLADGRWNGDVYVVLSKGSKFAEKKFSTTTTFASREEANDHGIEFGRKVIDGEVTNCTVGDL